MRLVSLEIPEADATRYQNLMRQNPKSTRSDATKYIGSLAAQILLEGVLGVERALRRGLLSAALGCSSKVVR